MMKIEEFEKKIGYQFHNPDYAVQALTHRSFHNENELSSVGNNERLEFLGDAILDSVVSQILIEKFPFDDEGALSQKRAYIVKEAELAKVSRRLGLDHFLLLSRGEKIAGGASKPRLLASVLEALIGAVFTDSSYESCLEWVKSVFCEEFESLQVDKVIDYKTRLQTAVQSKYRRPPEYKLDSAKGPDHNKSFAVSVWIGAEKLAEGVGRSKKIAEQHSAKKALEKWSEYEHG